MSACIIYDCICMCHEQEAKPHTHDYLPCGDTDDSAESEWEWVVE